MYDVWGHMVESYVGGLTTEYTYYPDGLRKTKTVNEETTQYYYDGDVVVNETVNGQWSASNVKALGNRIVKRTTEDGENALMYNSRGDVVMILAWEDSAEPVAAYLYLAYGKLYSDLSDFYGTATLYDPCVFDCPILYAGQYYDHETGLYYLRARYYSPDLCRFISEDPIKDGLNWYAYCNNNPILFVDPLGLDAILINKPVDNAANKIGVEHTSAFFQDENGDWWYFFYGDTVQYVKVDDTSIFKSMDTINEWLIDNKLLNSDNPYRDSVYIKGDFTASHEGALDLLDAYNNELPDVLSGNLPKGDFGVLNSHYKLLTNNCSQVAMGLFMKGTLTSGTNVGDYITSNGYGVAVIPNWNMINMQSIFYNSSTNLAGFEAAMQTQQNKYEGKSGFVQWWYSGLRKNINTIS